MEAFAKKQDALVLPAETDNPMDSRALIVDDYRIRTGAASGLELSLHRIAGRFDVGLSYAFGQAERRAGRERFTPRFDRRHQLDVNSEYRWGARGLLNARLVLASGQPFTPVEAFTRIRLYHPVQQLWTDARNAFVMGDHNSARLPGYVRLDVAARRSYRRRWFGRDGALTPYLQIVNVLNNKNAMLAEPQPYGQPRLEYWPQFPIIPTFGVEWRF